MALVNACTNSGTIIGCTSLQDRLALMPMLVSPIYRVGAILTSINVGNNVWDICRRSVAKYVPLHVNIFLAINVLDCLDEIQHLRLVGLRSRFIHSLAELEWVQYWQCSLSNVGNRLSYR